MKTPIYKTDVSDEELVAEIIKTKNAAFFGILYDRYSKMVLNKCYGFARSEMEAEDLTQDIFLKLYIKLGSFKGRSKFSSWLYAFTYNYCVNYVTRENHKKIEKAAHPLEDNELHIETDDYSLFQLRVNTLRKVLNSMPPEDKMLLLLKYQDGVSITELADVLELGESAVKMRLKRAKAKVVKIYNEMNL